MQMRIGITLDYFVDMIFLSHDIFYYGISFYFALPFPAMELVSHLMPVGSSAALFALQETAEMTTAYPH